MVASVRQPGSMPKLVNTWTDPWRVVTADKVLMYGVQIIVAGEVKDVHVVCLRLYADKDLEMTVALKEVFQRAFTQGEFEIAGIVDIWEVEDRQVLMSRCTGLDLTRGRVRGSRLQLYGTASRSLSSRSCGS